MPLPASRCPHRPRAAAVPRTPEPAAAGAASARSRHWPPAPSAAGWLPGPGPATSCQPLRHQVHTLGGGDLGPDDFPHPGAAGAGDRGGAVDVRRLVRGPALSDGAVHRLDQHLDLLADPLLGALRGQLLDQPGQPGDPPGDRVGPHLAVMGRRLGAVLVGVPEHADRVHRRPGSAPASTSRFSALRRIRVARWSSWNRFSRLSGSCSPPSSVSISRSCRSTRLWVRRDRLTNIVLTLRRSSACSPACRTASRCTLSNACATSPTSSREPTLTDVTGASTWSVSRIRCTALGSSA